MHVPLLDLKAQLQPLREEILAAVTEVVDSTRYIMGPRLEALEEEVASYSGTRYGIGVSSGTDALLVSLMALGVGQGDLVLTTPYTFFATMGVVLRLGARPVFVDIDPETYNIDPYLLDRTLEEHARVGKSIKAMIPVHLY
jgi:dTDP-4-amino-4,6-dideoxygalactose transaminase